MDFEKLDLKLKLLSGESIKVDNRVGCIKPLTIRQIISYGYSNYLRKLNLLVVDLSDLVDVNTVRLNLNLFDILTDFGEQETIKELEEALSLFFQDEAVLYKEAGIIIIGDPYAENKRIIDRDNFDKVREVIKWQNCLKKFSDEDDSNARATDKAKEIMAKLKRSKQITSKVKGEENEGELDLSDMLSSIASRSNSLNKLNIFDLTLYQLYDEFKRLDLIDQYDIGIKSMLAGAKKVKLKHWSSKLD